MQSENVSNKAGIGNVEVNIYLSVDVEYHNGINLKAECHGQGKSKAPALAFASGQPELERVQALVDGLERMIVSEIIDVEVETPIQHRIRRPGPICFGTKSGEEVRRSYDGVQLDHSRLIDVIVPPCSLFRSGRYLVHF